MKNSATFYLGILALTGSLISCSNEEGGISDQNLGNLVIAQKTEVVQIDLDETGKKVENFLTTLNLSHSLITTNIGHHRIDAATTVLVTEAGQEIESLEDTLFLEINAQGHYHLKLENSKEYGRHVIFDGKHLYLRPRFGKYHMRLPQTEEEPIQSRNEVYAGAMEYLDLFANQLAITDLGNKTLEDRPVREIQISLAPEKRNIKQSPQKQKQWRHTIVIQSIDGKAMFHPENGALLHLDFKGILHFNQKGRRFTMAVNVSHTATPIGQPMEIQIPSEEQIYRIPARRRELSERNHLLKGIAPPARKAPTPQENTP